MEIIKALCWQCEKERPLDKFLRDSQGEIGGICVYCFLKSIGAKRPYRNNKIKKKSKNRWIGNLWTHRNKIRKLLNKKLSKNKIYDLLKNENINKPERLLFIKKLRQKINKCEICGLRKGIYYEYCGMAREVRLHIKWADKLRKKFKIICSLCAYRKKHGKLKINIIKDIDKFLSETRKNNKKKLTEAK